MLLTDCFLQDVGKHEKIHKGHPSTFASFSYFLRKKQLYILLCHRYVGNMLAFRTLNRLFYEIVRGSARSVNYQRCQSSFLYLSTWHELPKGTNITQTRWCHSIQLGWFSSPILIQGVVSIQSGFLTRLWNALILATFWGTKQLVGWCLREKNLEFGSFFFQCMMDSSESICLNARNVFLDLLLVHQSAPCEGGGWREWMQSGKHSWRVTKLACLLWNQHEVYMFYIVIVPWCLDILIYIGYMEYIYIYFLSLYIYPLCFHHKQYQQHDVCDTFSIFLRISDSGIQDQIFSNKKCKQKLPYWGSDKEDPLKDGVYLPILNEELFRTPRILQITG